MTSDSSDKVTRQRQAAAMKAERERTERRQRLTISITIVVVALLLIAVASWAISTAAKGNQSATEVIVPSGLVDGGVPFRTADGTPPIDGAPVVEVYEDFLCSHCAEFEERNGAWLRGLAAGGKIDLRFKPFPIQDDPRRSSGPAREVMNAAMCVADDPDARARFSDVKTMLFEAGYFSRDREPASKNLLEDIGEIATESVEACVRTGKFVPWLSEQRALHEKAGLTGTPTVKVDGTKLADFSRATIESALDL